MIGERRERVKNDSCSRLAQRKLHRFFQDALDLASLWVPEDDGVVAGCRCQRRPIGREGHGAHGDLMAFEPAQRFAVGQAPQPHRAVFAAARSFAQK
jgi:hypothetical protein